MSNDQRSPSRSDLYATNQGIWVALAVVVALSVLIATPTPSVAQSRSLGDLTVDQPEEQVPEIEQLKPPPIDGLTTLQLRPPLTADQVQAMEQQAILRLEQAVENGYFKFPSDRPSENDQVTYVPVALTALECNTNGPRLRNPFNDTFLSLTDEWHPLTEGPYFVDASDEQKSTLCRLVFDELTSIANSAR